MGCAYLERGALPPQPSPPPSLAPHAFPQPCNPSPGPPSSGVGSGPPFPAADSDQDDPMESEVPTAVKRGQEGRRTHCLLARGPRRCAFAKGSHWEALGPGVGAGGFTRRW